MKSDQESVQHELGDAVPQERPFLTAAWRSLVMLSYEVEPALLEPYVPAGTTLDPFQGCYYLSLVAFRFLGTRVLGIPVPLHRDFDEINLRFYVRRGDRRGVVFIKEIVPMPAIAWVARLVYNEPYVWCRTRSDIRVPQDTVSQGSLSYEWHADGRWHAITARISGEPAPLVPGSEEEFITEHYWGYTPQRDGGTIEYRVTHPSWRVWTAEHGSHQVDIGQVYGKKFVEALSGTPRTAFVAEGSGVAVYRGKRIC